MLAVLMAPLPAIAETATGMNATLDTLFGEHARYRSFFDALKKAVSEGDKAAVAAMVDYPFQARIGGKSVKIRDAAHFVADYDKVVTAKVKSALHAQGYESLFANWQGVMVGDGEIWFSGVGDANEIKITAIND
jgi:predicted component of type VI protein secretion system